MIEYTIQPTHKGQFIIRNPMGNECAKLDTQANAETWIEQKHEQEIQDQRAADTDAAEQKKFNVTIPDLNKLQIRWQNWRNWFYNELVHEDRSLGSHRRALDMIPDGASGEFGTSGSPSYARHEQGLTDDQITQVNAHALYERAVSVDILIKNARRSKNQSELTRLLIDEAELIIAAMNGFFLYASRPEEYKIPGRPTLYNEKMTQTAVFFRGGQLAWLKSHTGKTMSEVMRDLVDEAMK